MKSCNTEPAALMQPCDVKDVDNKGIIASIEILKEDCKDEITFIKRLIREKRLVSIEGNFIHTAFVIDSHIEITVTYRSRDDKQRTLIF